MKKSKPTKIEQLYKKLGLVEVTTPRQKRNGTVVFFDDQSNRNYIFREYSDPRVEYVSSKTRTLQSYRLFELGESLKDDMRTAIPFIVRRKVSTTKERAKIALDIAARII
jgi:hypothetical protein